MLAAMLFKKTVVLGLTLLVLNVGEQPEYLGFRRAMLIVTVDLKSYFLSLFVFLHSHKFVVHHERNRSTK